MKILATICLNEEEFIGDWLSYHYETFDKIVLVEGAAVEYPRDAVTDQGLSTDRTAEIISNFPDTENKITFIQHGWAGKPTQDTAVPSKMELRNRYAEILGDGYLFTMDIDEFLSKEDANTLAADLEEDRAIYYYVVPILHLWQDTGHFIVGGYADVAHCRLVRFVKGCRYTKTHNWPALPQNNRKVSVLSIKNGVACVPTIVHYGFCERKTSMLEKNQYYINRGEENTRKDTTYFRNCAYQGIVPEKCKVFEYKGHLPR